LHPVTVLAVIYPSRLMKSPWWFNTSKWRITIDGTINGGFISHGLGILGINEKASSPWFPWSSFLGDMNHAPFFDYAWLMGIHLGFLKNSLISLGFFMVNYCTTIHHWNPWRFAEGDAPAKVAAHATKAPKIRAQFASIFSDKRFFFVEQKLLATPDGSDDHFQSGLLVFWWTTCFFGAKAQV